MINPAKGESCCGKEGCRRRCKEKKKKEEKKEKGKDDH
jgi:hypothetical protein